MYLERILYINVGPIEKVDLHLLTENNRSPHPTVFVGKNGSGKSVLLSNIVDAIYGISITLDRFCPNKNKCGPSKIDIIDGESESKVYKLGDDQINYALPKMEFAKRVLNKEAPFDNMDFTGFIPLFRIIREILEQ